MAKVLCMEIGVSMTKIVEMDYMAKKPRVYRCLEMKTPQDTVKDGYLNEERMDILKEAIKNTLTQHKIRTKRVLFTIFSGKIISREIMLPNVRPHQIKAVIEANISGYFPIELDDYKVSHFHINTIREGENAGKHKVMVIAAEKKLLDGYDKLATELGLRIVDIDYAGNSVVQAVRHSAGAGAVMVVKVEEENAIITILHQGIFVLQRNMSFPQGLTQADADEREELEENLVNTMMRVADFYASHNEENKLEQIFIMGEGSRENHIKSMVSERIGISCRTLDTVRGVIIHKNAMDAQLNLYGAAIGSGISSVGFANEKELERHETNYVSATLLMSVFFVVLIATIVMLALIPYRTALMDEQMLKRKQETYAPAKAVYDQYVNMGNVYQHIEYGHLLTEHSNDAILVFLAELEEKMPKDVEMTEFSSNDEMCVMTMRVVDKETASGVINKLRDFTSISAVTVESIVEETDAEEQIQTGKIYFTITCYYNTAEPVKPTGVQE